MFLIGNFIAMPLGFYFGNIYFSLAIFGLTVFTVIIVKPHLNKMFYTVMLFITYLMILVLGPVDFNTVSFSPHGVIDVIATITAWAGSYAMYRGNYVAMAWAWIIADLGFLWIAYDAAILGLGIQASFFIYHGALRILENHKIQNTNLSAT